MSKEVQIGFPCPHLIIEEWVSLSADRRTLRPKAGIASSQAVRILANDEIYIPPSGLFSQATLLSEQPGPYTITDCDTGITINEIPILIPPGRYTAVRLASLLQAQLPEIQVSVIDHYLELIEVGHTGQESRLLISNGSAIGFSKQRGSRGREIYPGWSLLADYLLPQERYPKFNAPVSLNPVLKCTYSTFPPQCLRCRGTYVENDARFDINGDILLIDKANLLYQSALKIVLTQIQSNPYHMSYGSLLTSRIGMKALGGVSTLLTEDVQNALKKMQNIQTQQARFQEVSLQERLYGISSIQTTQSASDPSAFLVDIVVVSAANESVAISIVFSVPGVYALSGANGQSLGLEAIK